MGAGSVDLPSVEQGLSLQGGVLPPLQGTLGRKAEQVIRRTGFANIGVLLCGQRNESRIRLIRVWSEPQSDLWGWTYVRTLAEPTGAMTRTPLSL